MIKIEAYKNALGNTVLIVTASNHDKETLDELDLIFPALAKDAPRRGAYKTSTCFEIEVKPVRTTEETLENVRE